MADGSLAQQEPYPTKSRPKPYYGWTIVLLMGLLAFAGGTQTNPVLGVFQGPMTGDLGWTRTSFTAPMTIGTMLGGILAVWVGAMLDKHGGRWILGTAAALLGLDFILMGFVHELWEHYVLQIVGRALMSGVFFLATNVVISKWFLQKRGRASALAGLGMRLGQSVLPVTTERIIHWGNWRMAWFSMGAVIWLVTVVPVIKFMRRSPEDMGLLPDGAKAPSMQSVVDTNGGIRKAAEVSLTLSQARKTSAFYLLLASACIQTFTVSAVHFHWFSYLTGAGVSSGSAVGSIAVSSLLAVPVSLLAGVVIDRIHIRYVLAAGFVIVSLSEALLLATNTAFLAYAFGVVFAIATGITFTATGIVWANYFGRASAGSIAGAISPLTMLLNAMGPLIAAMSFDAAHSYTLIFTTGVVLNIVGAGLYILAAPPKLLNVAKPVP